MLSRTADCIYWMSRQMERAENMARLLDVMYQMSLMPGSLTPELLRAPLEITGTEEAFSASGEKLTIDGVLRFFTLAPNNPSSIFSSLKQARENAHVVRGRITSDMWETMNATWLEARELNREKLRLMGYGKFFDWVKERSHLFRGVTFGTIRRGDAFNFSRLGTFLERADNTSRILLVKAPSLIVADNSSEARDHYQWGALLRSLSAFESYREIYRDSLNPVNVTDMLLLRDDFPRSLHACINEIVLVLDSIEGVSGIDAQRLAAEIHARLHYARIHEVLEEGLQDYLHRFLIDTNELGLRIQHAYLEAA